MTTDNNATVEIAEEGVVTVDLTDNPELAGAEADPVVEVEPEPKPAKVAREKPAKVNAADEAAAALTQAVKTAEDGRKAAEATAVAERRGREDAQRLAAQRENEAKGYREQAEDHQLTIINGGIESAKRDLEASQSELERAMEAGEFSKASAAQVKLAKAASALDRLEDAKANFDAGARKVPTTEGRVEAPVAQGSLLEQYLSGFAPQAQTWLRSHSECVPAQFGGNQVSNSKMMAGHYDALAKGLQPNTTEYFQTIEEHTGHRTPVSAAAAVVEAGADDAPAPAPKPKPRMAQPSAPVSRDPPSANGLRTTRSVTLSKEQQDAAKMSFPQKPVNEAFALYARNLIELEAEGKMGRLTH